MSVARSCCPCDAVIACCTMESEFAASVGVTVFEIARFQYDVAPYGSKVLGHWTAFCTLPDCEIGAGVEIGAAVGAELGAADGAPEGAGIGAGPAAVRRS